jgi:hypothetical protein
MNLFIGSADELYGPITTIRRDGRIHKHIPWTAFALKPRDWERVNDTRVIISVGPAMAQAASHWLTTSRDERMLMTYSNIFQTKSGQLCGVRSLQ